MGNIRQNKVLKIETMDDITKEQWDAWNKSKLKSLQLMDKFLIMQQEKSERAYSERMSAYDLLYSMPLQSEVVLEKKLQEFKASLIRKAEYVLSQKQAGKNADRVAKDLEEGYALLESLTSTTKEYRELITRIIDEVKGLDEQLRRAKKIAEGWQSLNKRDEKIINTAIKLFHDN